MKKKMVEPTGLQERHHRASDVSNTTPPSEVPATYSDDVRGTSMTQRQRQQIANGSAIAAQLQEHAQAMSNHDSSSPQHNNRTPSLNGNLKSRYISALASSSTQSMLLQRLSEIMSASNRINATHQRNHSITHSESKAPTHPQIPHQVTVQRLSVGASNNVSVNFIGGHIEDIKQAYIRNKGDPGDHVDWNVISTQMQRVANDPRNYRFALFSDLIDEIINNGMSADTILANDPVAAVPVEEGPVVEEEYEYQKYNKNKDEEKKKIEKKGGAEQARVLALYEGILKKANTLTVIEAKRKKKRFEGELSAQNFQALFDTSRKLAGLLRIAGFIAYPGDILDAASLNDEKNIDTILLTLCTAIPFLEAILAILNDESDSETLVFSGVLFEILLSNFGKNCITSIGSDVVKSFSLFSKK